MEFNIQNILVFVSLGLAILYLVKKYNPKTIIISEPRPSVVYKTSDLSEIFSTWAYESWFFELDIRMGDRVVYALETDRPRSIFNRKIKKTQCYWIVSAGG